MARKTASKTKKTSAEPKKQPETIQITPRTENQAIYMDAIRRNDVVFGIGPAGTGKTFLAAAMAVDYLKRGIVSKIVLCRPIVEAADEHLGFLPGNLNDKCDPYLRPLFDALELCYTQGAITQLRQHNIIEISPLAYMRGRTFIDSFVICDEIQNSSDGQLKMLLTRIGEGSKMVLTGDPDQRDRVAARGFEVARERLADCPAIEFIDFGNQDIVRHKTVAAILDRW